MELSREINEMQAPEKKKEIKYRVIVEIQVQEVKYL